MATKRKITSKKSVEKSEKKGFFSRFANLKFTDSYTSLILGVVAVLVAGLLFFGYTKLNKTSQNTSSMSDEMESQSQNTLSTYTVKPGDDLWTISENIYKDGYKWVEIAKANNLENPGIIHAGDKLKITPIEQLAKVEPTVEPTVQPTSALKPATTVAPTKAMSEKAAISGGSYTVQKGDYLWEIAIRAYGDGYKWTEIAQANKLDNPNVIHSGNILKLPR